MKLTAEEIQTLKGALAQYNNSPWRGFGRDISLEAIIQKAENEGVEVALKSIDDADKFAFHREEALAGNI